MKTKVGWTGYQLAWAAATDEGKRHATACGRSVWIQEDYDWAARTLERLIGWYCECCNEPAGEGNALCPACQESR